MTRINRPGKPRPLKDRPVYFVVRQMVSPETGEIAGCLVPNSWADNHLMRERRFHKGAVVRATLVEPRDVSFHQLVHQLGVIVKENIEGFEGMTAHAAIKRLQRESGVCCETIEVDATSIVSAVLAAAESVAGPMVANMLKAVLPEIKTVQMKIATSIAFDCMDEQQFKELWRGICGHLVKNYWPSLTVEQITEMAKVMPRSEGA